MASTWPGQDSWRPPGVLAGCVGLLVFVVPASEQLAAEQARTASSVMALLAVAGVAMGAILAQVAGRLAADRRIAGLSALAALYGLLAAPDALGMDPSSVGAGLLRVSTLVLVSAGLLFGPALICVGRAERNPTLTRLGSAVVLIAVAHGYGLWAAAGPARDLTFAAVRLAGVLAFLVAVVSGTHRAIMDADLEQSEQQEELLLARRGLRQAAERDHEVRNAVAGLAGAATLLDPHSSAERPAADTITLRTALVAELARLDALLGGSPAAPAGQPEPIPYRLRPVLSRQVALRRCTGMRVELAAEPGLGAVGSPALLAQVLTNVLSNCAAHAPGSPVRIEAVGDGAQVLIRVSDLGPGIAVPPGYDVFESGVRGARSGGDGLGLHISRRLLAEEGGSITILPRSVEQPGCTVELRLAAAPVARRIDEPAALRTVS